MFLHVVQGTLGDPLLEDEVFQLMAVAVVFDSGCDFAEAVEEDLVICTVLLIVPGEIDRQTRVLHQHQINLKNVPCLHKVHFTNFITMSHFFFAYVCLGLK